MHSCHHSKSQTQIMYYKFYLYARIHTIGITLYDIAEEEVNALEPSAQSTVRPSLPRTETRTEDKYK